MLANTAVHNLVQARASGQSGVLPAWLWMVALAVVAQVAVIYGVSRSHYGDQALPVLLILSHLLLVPFLLRNLSSIGFRLVLVGLLLNLTVMVSNGGFMPAAPDAVRAVDRLDPAALQLGEPIQGTKNVYLLPQDARLRELSDVIILPLPHPYTKAVSIGDLAVVLGIAIALAETGMRASRGSLRA